MFKNDTSTKPSEITPEPIYLGTRRSILNGLGAYALSGSISRNSFAQQDNKLQSDSLTKVAQVGQKELRALSVTRQPAIGEGLVLSDWNEVANHVLYHEFGESAEEAIKKSVAIRTDPWTVSVEGEVANAKVYGIEELLKLAPLEERIYRHRCVGGWYMVVPWVGYSLSEIIRRVQPTGNAKYVEFTSHWDSKIMGNAFYTFPYVESLRIDEAMHSLTLLCFGHHGRVLPKQNGAPLRIITPWKYAHKSPKAIVKIRFTERQPAAFFYTQYSHLYGYYRNVHPDLAQGGSQRTEKRVGEWFRRRETPLLNGYAQQVAGLYGDQLNTLR
jgi:methionine sulfoxide reductase catalytic subunit